MHSIKFLAFAAIAPLTISAIAQTTPPGGQTTPAAPPAGQTTPPAAPKQDFKPYDQVVTKEAVTQDGVFKVHRIDDKMLWEIPANLLGRDFLVQSELSEISQGAPGYAGMTVNSQVIKFTRRNKRIFIRGSRFILRNPDGSMKTGIEQMSVEPIIAGLEIQTEGKEKSVVIDVTGIFSGDMAPFQVGPMMGGQVDGSKSWIDRVKAFPTNIETRTNLTMMGGRGGGNPFAPPAAAGPFTATMHHSLLLLPEKPMMPRFKDSRIGYFTTDYSEFREDRPVKERALISRFRLEKKDPNSSMSEPVKPITFYLAREIPARWREPLRRGVLRWNEAYEAAGFKNAVVCLDAPSKEQDPSWDAEDARYSVIRWAPSPVANAMGPSIQDPRSGETLNAHIIFWHNIIDILQKWYFTQCAAIDPRARGDMDPKLMDALVEYVSAHEVGHTLGLEHNFRASSAYTIQQLRDPSFVRNNGVSSSIMSYSRNNYVAQPGDGIDYSTNGFIGPYDKFAIKYGYMVIPGASSPESEMSALDRLLSQQINDRTVRFGNYKYNVDPTTMSENISDDPVEATRLGLMNLDRIGKNYLLKAATKFGEDYTDLNDYFGALQQHRMMWIMHVMRQVGGVVEVNTHAGRGKDVFQPVAKAQQAKAVKFLSTIGLNMPPGLANPDVLLKLRPDGYLSQMNSMQNMLVSQLFAENRLRRLFDWEHMKGKDAYTVQELTDTVFAGVWAEVGEAKPTIPMLRRDLQRSFLRGIEGRVAGPSRSGTDFVLIGQNALRSLAKKIDKAIPKAGDSMTALHLQDSRKWIGRILDGKVPGTAATGGSIFDMFGVKPGTDLNHRNCFSQEAMLREFLRGIEN